MSWRLISNWPGQYQNPHQQELDDAGGEHSINAYLDSPAWLLVYWEIDRVIFQQRYVKLDDGSIPTVTFERL